MSERELPSMNIPEIEIGRNAQKIKNYLETLAVNGLGKPIYVTKKIKDDSLPSYDTLTRLERLINPPPPKITKELAAIALPLSKGKKSPWLIITIYGDFIRVDPPENEHFFSQLKMSFIDLEVIELSEEEFKPANPHKEFLMKLSTGSIIYNTATDYPTDETEAQIKNDFYQAIEVAREIKDARLKAKQERQQMLLEKLRSLLNPPHEEKTD